MSDALRPRALVTLLRNFRFRPLWPAVRAIKFTMKRRTVAFIVNRPLSTVLINPADGITAEFATTPSPSARKGNRCDFSEIKKRKKKKLWGRLKIHGDVQSFPRDIKSRLPSFLSRVKRDYGAHFRIRLCHASPRRIFRGGSMVWLRSHTAVD